MFANGRLFAQGVYSVFECGRRIKGGGRVRVMESMEFLGVEVFPVTRTGLYFTRI